MSSGKPIDIAAGPTESKLKRKAKKKGAEMAVAPDMVSEFAGWELFWDRRGRFLISVEDLDSVVLFVDNGIHVPRQGFVPEPPSQVNDA